MDVRTLQRNYFSMHANVIMSQQPLLHALHWLPAQARIDYKLSTVCHSLFLGSSLAYRSDLFTVSFFCRHTDISYPMLTQNPLASAVPLTVFQGNEILPLLISITFSVPMHSKLHSKLISANSTTTSDFKLCLLPNHHTGELISARNT